MVEGLSGRTLMEHRDAQGQSVFTSRAWRRLFEVRGPLVHEIILELFSTFRFGEAVLYLDTDRALQFQLGEVRRRINWREFILAQSYTAIRDPMLRLYHRLIACNIVGSSQAPEKVTVTDLFYLMGMDVGSVNTPYLLARYLRRFDSGRKHVVMISGGQFVARLAEHFGPFTKQRLLGLTLIAVPTLVQAPQSPHAARPARTLSQRVARLEEEVHGIGEALGEQREVLDSMARNFSRFTIWVVISLSLMMDRSRVRYTSYSDFRIPYQRRVRRKIGEVSTSVAPLDED
ncbi:hypothetical protein Tco_0435646 [Tanacetum coccineum]